MTKFASLNRIYILENSNSSSLVRTQLFVISSGVNIIITVSIRHKISQDFEEMRKIDLRSAVARLVKVGHVSANR